MANLNCIKAVLAEKGIMSKWLAKTLKKDPTTVSKWCNNHSQPDLCTLARIAEVLDVDIYRLFVIQKKNRGYEIYNRRNTADAGRSDF